MVDRQFSNFEQLYRAAFAEIDPGRKPILLGEVCKAIEQWERSLGSCATDGPPQLFRTSCLQHWVSSIRITGRGGLQ
jgi:hypothetical protein